MKAKLESVLKKLALDKVESPKKVVVGLSGGVDSAVAALILKAQGHEVIGLFMKNWQEESEYCSAEKDYQDVMRVCQQLGIVYYSIDLVQEYQQHVFDQFIADYRRGLTPNPDLFCNREIKFKFFYDYAFNWGADYMATGHYCQVKQVDGQFQLHKGVDPNKDQSYFLATINPQVLSRVLFPLGGLLKTQVREIAKDFGLANQDKKDSTGICFIGERDFKEFLSQYIEKQKGPFQTLDGQVVGEHDGMCFYTLGQRKGLGLGGAGEPWFVVDKDPEKNIVYVERGDHPRLYRQMIGVKDFSWLTPNVQESSVMGKIRYRSADQECCLQNFKSNSEFEVHFSQWQRAMSLGQFFVAYQQTQCLGGGIISHLGAPQC